MRDSMFRARLVAAALVVAAAARLSGAAWAAPDADTKAAVTRALTLLRAVGEEYREALDESRARHEVDEARVRELEGQLEVARLTARPDQIRAQTAEVGASRAACELAGGEQKQQAREHRNHP